jgi:hypothetical protein
MASVKRKIAKIVKKILSPWSNSLFWEFFSGGIPKYLNLWQILIPNENYTNILNDSDISCAYISR